LPSGAHVLDACCGSGASAIPAAKAVGPGGTVVGVDLADGLLARARAKTRAAGLSNVTFQVGDMLELNLSSAS
jgi:ubiquinone/menaquinone biosynthesis C-methylase UbiE